MEQLIIKKHIRLIFLTSLFIFILNKFVFRPFVLSLGDSSYFLKVITWSLPNFIEAVMGSIVVTGLLFLLKIRLSSLLNQLKEIHIYSAAIVFSGIYVLSQELKWHNLGGRNVYDPNDFIASILGLLFMLIVFYKYGFRK